MTPFFALLRKHIHETRWNLGLSAAALFGLGWLFVFITSLNETEILKRLASDDGGGGGRIQWMRNMGIGEAPSSASIMMTFWSHPFIMLVLSMWAIGRASSAVAAEVERGTMDLMLSRPVPRSAYLASHVSIALAGLAILAIGLLAGASIAVQYNVLRERPSILTLARPAINLAALGFPIYGYTLLASSLDHVRWRPTTIGSVLTLAGFIAFVVSLIPVLQDRSWRPWLERISIFKAYNPVELVGSAETMAQNLAILGSIGTVAIALAFVAFAYRDLPANG
jgi:ABC-2 type transport system permease protein